MAETHAQYYEVLAENEDQARERAYDYDEDKSWELSTWDEGVNYKFHSDTEEVGE